MKRFGIKERGTDYWFRLLTPQGVRVGLTLNRNYPVLFTSKSIAQDCLDRYRQLNPEMKNLIVAIVPDNEETAHLSIVDYKLDWR